MIESLNRKAKEAEQDYERDIRTLEDEQERTLQLQREAHSQLESDNEQLRKLLAQAEASSSGTQQELEAELSKLKRQASSEAHALQDKENEIARLNKLHDSDQLRIAALEQKTDSLKTHVSSEKQTLEDRHAEELVRLGERLDALRRDKDEAEASLQEELSSARRQYSDDKKALEEKYLDQISALESELVKAQSRQTTDVSSLKHENDRLKAAMETMCEQHQAELERLEKSASGSREKGQQQTGQLQEELAAAKMDVARLERELAASEQDCRLANTRNQATEERIAAYEKQINSTKDRATRAEAEIEEVLKQLSELKIANRKLTTDSQVAEHSIADLETQLQDAQTRCDREKTARQELEQKKIDLEAKIKEAQAQVEAMEQQFQTDRNQLSKSMTTEATQRTAELNGRIQQLEKEVELAHKSADHAKEETSALHAKLLDTENVVAQSQLRLEQSELKLLEKDEQLQDLQNEQRRKTVQLQHDLDDAEHERERLARELEMHKSAAARDRTQLTEEVEELHQRLKEQQFKHSAALAAVDADVADKSRALSQATAKVQELEEDLAAAKAGKREAREQEVQQLADDLELAQKQRDDALKQRSTLEQDLAALEEEQRALQEQVMLLEGELRAQQASGSKPPVHLRFAEMDASNLSEEQAIELCLRDEETEEARMQLLEHVLALTIADDALTDAQEAFDADPSDANKAALEQATLERQRTEAVKDEAEPAFEETARSALERLQKQEKELAAHEDPRFVEDFEDSRPLLFDRHGQAQQQIVEMLRQLRELRELEQGQPTDGGQSKDLEAMHAQNESTISGLQQQLEEQKALLEEQARAMENAKRAHSNDGHDHNDDSARDAETSVDAEDLKNLRVELSNWINLLAEADTKPETLMEDLKDGIALCKVANSIEESEELNRMLEDERGLIEEVAIDEQGLDITYQIRNRELMDVQYLPDATPGSDDAASNVEAFITWAEGAGVYNPEVFCPEDLIENESEENVLFGLLRVARRTRNIELPEILKRERAPFQPSKPKVYLSFFLSLILILIFAFLTCNCSQASPRRRRSHWPHRHLAQPCLQMALMRKSPKFSTLSLK